MSPISYLYYLFQHVEEFEEITENGMGEANTGMDFITRKLDYIKDKSWDIDNKGNNTPYDIFAFNNCNAGIDNFESFAAQREIRPAVMHPIPLGA